MKCDAIDRAVYVAALPDEWKALVRRAMELDFSWDSSAKKYEELYKYTIKKRKM